jgi:hypothetical protein
VPNGWRVSAAGEASRLNERSGASDLRNLEVLADFARQIVIDFSVARYGRGLSRGAVYVHGVPPTFAKKDAAMSFKVA